VLYLIESVNKDRILVAAIIFLINYICEVVTVWSSWHLENSETQRSW